MELQHAFAFTSLILDRQQERLQPLAPAQLPGTGSSRRSRGPATKLVAGLLVLFLLAVAVAPAIAAGPRQAAHGSSAAQEHGIDAAKKKGKTKTRTITRGFQSGDANGAEISIPAVGSVEDFGPADPYPSTIEATGFKRARIADVNLTLHGLSHAFSGDVSLLLVAPDGRNAFVMGDIGEVVTGSSAVSNLSVTLDDEATEQMSGTVALTSGTFQPFDFDFFDDFDEFPAPSPAPSGDVALATFDGSDPNGAWRLFVFDDGSGDVGQVAEGWSLEITAKSKVKDKAHGQHKHSHKHKKRR